MKYGNAYCITQQTTQQGLMGARRANGHPAFDAFHEVSERELADEALRMKSNILPHLFKVAEFICQISLRGHSHSPWVVRASPEAGTTTWTLIRDLIPVPSSAA